jgi:hypothetical protein
MGRTEMSVEELRREEVLSRVKSKTLKVVDAASLVGVSYRQTTPQACKEAEITQQTYYCWRKEFGGLKLDQGKRPNLAVLTRSGGIQAALMDAADSGAQFQGRSSWMRLIGWSAMRDSTLRR